MITDLAARLKEEGSSLAKYLDSIWNEIGYHATKQVSIRFDDPSLIPPLMELLRLSPPEELRMSEATYRFTSLDDLDRPTDALPPTDGLRLWFTRDGSDEKIRVIIRPSGTEPKLKCYIEVVGDASRRDAVDAVAEESARLITEFLNAAIH